MRKKPYPKLTHENATFAAEIYLEMRESDRLIWRTVDFTGNSRSALYVRTLSALHRLEDNYIVKSMTVGDAGNIWWLREREIPAKRLR